MEKVISLLHLSIEALNQLDAEIERLDEEEYKQVADAYPFDDFFNCFINDLDEWKNTLSKASKYREKQHS